MRKHEKEDGGEGRVRESNDVGGCGAAEKSEMGVLEAVVFGG